MKNVKKVNLLIIIPNLGGGGAQKIFHQQIASLADEFNVTACVFNWDGAFTVDLNEDIISLDVPGGTNVVTKVWYFMMRVIRIRKIKITRKIEVSISHLEGADYVNLLSKASDKTICWIHGTKRHDKNIKGILGFLRKKILMPVLYRRADKIVTVSKGIGEELAAQIKVLERKLEIVHNGFDITRITFLSNEKLDFELSTLFDQSDVIIAHCRLSHQKNLIAAIAIYKDIAHRENVKLVILGDGELRDQLVNACRSLDLSTWSFWESEKIGLHYDVYFIGQQENPFKFLRCAKLFIMTSYYEGFPLALCEAMACGLKVMVTDCFTGPREIISPGNVKKQPIAVPLYTPYGILMPLVDLADAKSISIWTKEIEKLIASFSIEGQDTLGVERIKEFDVKKSIRQTKDLINAV